MDRKLLEAVLFKFSGGPVGIANLAAAIGEEVDTIEDVLEPYLIQQGYLQRTPRGRIAQPRLTVISALLRRLPTPPAIYGTTVKNEPEEIRTDRRCRRYSDERQWRCPAGPKTSRQGL